LEKNNFMTVAALIVAAGRGTRAADEAAAPKQYWPLGGVTMLTRSIGAFAEHGSVDEILVVVHGDDAKLYQAAAAPYATRLRAPVLGGAMRQDSVRAGLEALSAARPTEVLIHDAARPFVDAALIDRVIFCLATHDAALPSLPVTDTIKRANDGHVTETLKRDGLWRAQTPQGFKFDAILAAHRKAAEAGLNDFTDDSAVAEWFGLDVGLVEGSEANRKLTSAEDLRSADDALRLRQGGSGTMRVAFGYDVHAFAPGDAVILCGVRIPHGKKLSGHSDADVALHALTDALLGVIADGDIGAHFPPSDERWRGQASSLFLKEAGSRVKARGGKIVHADITLICEAPRIGPYRDAMRANVANVLGLDIGQVSIKATTNEGLGFIGRGEGIAAMATATVLLP
jgi:2-C-methyl-D-erythritol 4-phosphate cytidylyltransferase / 2-C-methyl-D-erythritol 2,4-cyclodiphosphate synthase